MVNKFLNAYRFTLQHNQLPPPLNSRHSPHGPFGKPSGGRWPRTTEFPTVGVRLTVAGPTKRRVRLKWLRAAWRETFCHALCTIRDSWLHCGFCSVRDRAESISALALTWHRLLRCAVLDACPGRSSSRHKFGDHLCDS